MKFDGSEKSAKSALVESEKRFRTLFEQSPLSVQLLSVDGRTIQVNSAWKKLWGFSEEFVQSFILKEYNMLQDPQLVEKGIMEVIKKGFDGEGGKIPAIFYDTAPLGEGRGRWVEGHIEPIFGDNGNVRELVLIHQDVTEKIEFEQQLTAAKSAAEEGNRLKSAFLANMSHEIRTPLGAILGFTQLLKDRELPQSEFDEYFAVIDRSGKALTKIIDDILDLSKVEAGRLNIVTEAVDVEDIFYDIESMFRKQAEAKGLFIATEYSSKIETLHTDPARLRQILINLVGNALKFTQSGHIRLHIEIPKELSGKTLRISVIDSGMGIPKDQQSELFQPFNQVDGTHTRKFGGTGLGLALSKRLAQVMGGDVYLKSSELGRGSVFVVELPLKNSDDRKAPSKLVEDTIASPKKDLEGFKILVVDDLEDNRLLLARGLSKQGALIVEASNGAEAIEKAMRINDGKPFDVILMDVQMPVMDGFEAIQTLRKNKDQSAIIALTAHAMKEERDRALALGADAHFPKPVIFDDLVKVILNLK